MQENLTAGGEFSSVSILQITYDIQPVYVLH